MVRTKGKSGVYQILNLVNGKRYIGSAVNLSKRSREHFNALKRGDHFNQYLQRAWNRYGGDYFEFSVLRVCPKQRLIVGEREFLDFYSSFIPQNGYNLRSVADSNFGCRRSERSKEKTALTIQNNDKNKQTRFVKGRVPWNKDQVGVCSEKTRHKISDKQKGQPKGAFSEEHKVNMSKARKGMKFSEEHKLNISQAKCGTKLSEEVKGKISKAREGHSCDEETRWKISNAHKGRQLSEEHKRKLSDAKIGQCLGNRHSEETKRKMSLVQQNNEKAKQTLKEVGRKHRFEAGHVPWNKGKKTSSPWNKGKKTGPAWNSGKKLSDEYRRKLSESHKGQVRTEEQKRKTSEALKGRRHNEETKRKISKAKKKKYQPTQEAE